jgi:clumping factor A
MKAGFFNYLIYILVIMLIIPGMTPGMASALDEDLGDHGNSNSGNSTADNGSSYIGDSGTTPDNGSSDSNNTSSDSDSQVDSGTTPDNGSSNSNNTSSDSYSQVDSGTTPDNGSSDSHNVDSGNEGSGKLSGAGNSGTGNLDTIKSYSRDSGTQNSNNTSSDAESSHNGTSGTGNVSSNSSSNDSYSSKSSGMAPVSSEQASNIAVKELSTRSVMAGYPVKFDFVENSTCITYIEFNPKKTFRRTTTVVEELKNTSTLVSTPPPGKIYKNVNIWVGEGAGLPTSIRDGLIGFRVEKSWIKEKNVSEALVTLQRYDKEWESLSTKTVGEDENYVYFEAKTPGYSSFAITEYAGQNENKNEILSGNKIQETLKNLGAGNGMIKNPMKAARILMAISLPLFMILVGYCILKKKI